MHFVYIIKNPENILYKGYTLNFKERIYAHNNNMSDFTSKKGPWVLVFLKSFSEKTEALSFEKMLKRQNHNYLNWLISSDRNELSVWG